MKFKGKSAVITGGTGNLGRTVVRRFLEEEAHVTVSWIVEEELARLKRELGELAQGLTQVRADVSLWNDARVLAQEALFAAKKVDFLIHLVGGYAGGLLFKTEEEVWDRMLNMNLKSSYQCARVFGEIMAQDAKGRMIFMAAQPALEDQPNKAAYSVSKAGVVKLVRVLAEEFKGSEITVNAIAPSVIDTEANRRMSPRADFSQWIKPLEIADKMIWLCSDEAKEVTGQVFKMYTPGT